MIPNREEKSRPAKVGPYLLERRLGSGGMGAVWRAWDERLQRPVAIKQVRPELRDRPGVRELLRHEAAAAARLNHPAIVHIYDILEVDDTDWIVMELVEGETLAQILTDGPLTLPQALRLGREIAKGLAKAHSQGIVHRDLKALNVMVTPSGHAKILDFGIAKLTSVAGGEIPGSALFRLGSVVGTPFAMSPEQICGTPLDHRSDLFSFGSLLYEMLTGVSPFLAETEAATLGRVSSQRQLPVRQLAPEVPPELSELVDWLLEKKARMRPQDAREVATVLNAILARQPPIPPAEGRSSRPRGSLRRTDDRPEDQTISLMPTLRRYDAVPGLATRAADASLGAGERRQVTVVCCGVVEITSPGTWRTPDAEDLAEIMPALRRVLYEVVTQFQGSSGTALGPQLRIYFGYPQAHDDDVKRAVLTARELVDRVRRADWKSRGGSPLALRAGVHSGPAIVSKNREHPEPLSMGSTLDVATSIQSVASPGEVLVSEATRRLTAKSFEMEGVLPGVSLPAGSTPVFRICGPLNASEQAFRTSVPLIAREGELDMLRQRWGLVQGGESQVVLISGEGGIGKSSLVHALRKSLGGLAPRWMLCYGVAHARSSPFFAIIEMLRRYWLASARSAAEELAILERLLGRYGLPVADDLPILALLLSLPLPEGTVPSPPSPETRWRTREVLLNLLLQATAELPGILVVEDLHWLDPSSLELIGALLEGAGGASLLVILTLRLDFELPWRHHAGWLQLHLSRLTDTDSIRLIDQVAGGERLPMAVKRQIVRKADGVPLFVEELSKSCIEMGEEAGGAEIRSLPGLLRDSLTARLDRLGSAREVAQLAAVIGRTFPFELLASVSALDPAALRQDLDVLVRADLLHRRGSGEGATYSFKHALLQEAACELLLPGDLERLHARVAETLVTRFSAIADREPELVAFHYTEAGNPKKAIEHWLQAGQRALERFANLEAREHFRNGLRLIESLPPEPGRDRFEMSLQIGSAHAVIVTRGHSDAEVEALFERALALGRQLGELPLQFQSLLWSFYACRGELAKAWSLAAQLLKAAKARRDPEGLILGLTELAMLQARLGRPVSALRALRRARELCPASLETAVSLFPGWDAKGHLACEMAHTLCDAGFPDQALSLGRQGVQMAESRGSSYGTALALMYLTFIHLARREYLEASQQAQRMRDLCQQHGFAFLAIHGCFLASLTSARLAPAEDAVFLIGEAIQALDALRRDHRQELHLPELLAWLAAAGGACGMTSEARWLLEEGLEIGRRTGERLGKAELFRLDGALLLAGSDGECPSPQVRRQAEVRLRTAVDEARAVGSLWMELRAATDLGCLLCEEGRSEDAAELVSGVVDRFEEGWETADLKAAVDLTTRLAPS